jgi:hypothetical protein
MDDIGRRAGSLGAMIVELNAAFGTIDFVAVCGIGAGISAMISA